MVTSGRTGGAASSLLCPLFDDQRMDLVEVARTAVSVHYETASSCLPVLSVCLPAAVMLPNALVTERLPWSGPTTIGDGFLTAPGGAWHVARWWLPPRPRGLRPPPVDVSRLTPEHWPSLCWGVGWPRPSYDGLVPAKLIGAGAGLTPTGDDVLAGALVAAHATADPRLNDWRRSILDLLTMQRTTAVSRAMLHYALDGYATPELADYLHAVCDGGPDSSTRALDRATVSLLSVGHSSGAALMTGVLHTLATTRMRGAA